MKTFIFAALLGVLNAKLTDQLSAAAEGAVDTTTDAVGSAADTVHSTVKGALGDDEQGEGEMPPGATEEEGEGEMPPGDTEDVDEEMPPGATE